jgi:hypothetical protein
MREAFGYDNPSMPRHTWFGKCNFAQMSVYIFRSTKSFYKRIASPFFRYGASIGMNFCLCHTSARIHIAVAVS